MIFNHLLQRRRKLIVGRMGLVYERRAGRQRVDEIQCLPRIIVEHTVVAEFDSGLNYQPDHAFPSAVQSTLFESSLKHFQS
jgi:hypothetical protein